MFATRRATLGTLAVIAALLLMFGAAQFSHVRADDGGGTPTAADPSAPAAQPTPAATPTDQTTPADQPPATDQPPADQPPADLPPPPPMPVRLIIPSLQLNAPIEDIGFDADGGMAVPSGPDSVGWFAPGFRPGDPGNAVMDGHVDWVDRAAIFWFVKDLTAGDEVDVSYDDGSTAAFSVDTVAVYPDDSTPLDDIFAVSDVPHLNLITCGGTFDHATHNYDHRTVVYTTEIPVAGQ
ncbi:MAG: class F sortase [Dehalococcoidia bacterium]